MSGLPRLLFSSADQPEEEAFETWRTLMAPLYYCEPHSCGGRHPGGSTLAYLLDDILINRTCFTAQRVTRGARLIETTPDHIFFHFWRSGGYSGEIGRQHLEYGPGVVALSDGKRVIDVRFNPGDTFGLIVPRIHFAGLDLDRQDPRFDSSRSRLLRARISALYRRMPSTTHAEVPALRADLIAFLRRILDLSIATDVLEGSELDQDLLVLAERYVSTNIGRTDLKAEEIAGAIGVSRATLYRVLQPRGGVMQFIKERRLLAIRDALMDPLERSTINNLATKYGMVSAPYLSRSFRERFDASPRDWRNRHRAQEQARSIHSFEPFWRWYYQLGQQKT